MSRLYALIWVCVALFKFWIHSMLVTCMVSKFCVCKHKNKSIISTVCPLYWTSHSPGGRDQQGLSLLAQKFKASLSCLLASVINGERYSFDLITGLVSILPLPVRSTLNINPYQGSNTLIMLVFFIIFANSRSWKIIWTAWRTSWANKSKVFLNRYDWLHHSWTNLAGSPSVQTHVLTYTA